MTQTEALKRIAAYPFSRAEELSVEQMREIARAALAQPEQEPVAWMYPDALCDRSCLYVCTKAFTQFPECATAPPPQRTAAEGEDTKAWVGLTPQERDEINEQVYGAVPHHVAFHHAIEAKLKEKNTRNGGCL